MFGDYSGPNKADKGIENGSCNRSRCQAPNAVWFNHSTRSWYCEDCRNSIESTNREYWNESYPMFETREMIVSRKQ